MSLVILFCVESKDDGVAFTALMLPSPHVRDAGVQEDVAAQRG